MELKSVGAVIAERTLIYGAEDESIVQVLIGAPQVFSDSNAYFCPFQIRGIGSGRVKYAVGIDAVQSLQLVMKMIAIDLACTGESLRWPLSETIETGFE